jgi:formate hydrogenlyase transcriptional activator
MCPADAALATNRRVLSRMNEPHPNPVSLAPLGTATGAPKIDRIEFENLLSSISAKLIGVEPEDLDATIQSAVDVVRQFFRADRCGLLTVSDDLELLRVSYGSYSEGTRQVSAEIDLGKLYPWTRKCAVIDRKIVCLTIPNDLPPEATIDRTTFEMMNTKSLAIIPIDAGSKHLHLVLISTVGETRGWPHEYLPRLQLLGEMLVNTIERTRALDELRRFKEKLEHENLYLRQQVNRRGGTEHIVGRGPAICRALNLAEQVAGTNSTVLLLGETGVGKGRLAAHIHDCSPRRERPMITVNCSAIPNTLFESELFGREKGAYTGALSKQIGRFELAHLSTLFIDEIGELPLEMQVKLLRVLESRSIERLGNPKPIPIDVRIIAASNRDLEAAIREGRFRKDLYYRINVFPITVPPLRERQEDVPLFVQAFVDEFSGSMIKPIDHLDQSSMKALMEYSWPGNVRELRNVVERAMIMTSGSVLRIAAPEADARALPGARLESTEREQVLRILEETGWRIRGAQGAASRLGMKPTTLESRMKSMGLVRPGNQPRS